MSASFVLFSCDSYKNSILSGFSRLQEQQEFVDLTLVAEEHFVKVHKNVMALASPYLKRMIQSTSSQNTIIFLNNVSYNILIYLLEYIYQGEVSVPEDSIEAFLQVAISLKISGMNAATPSKQNQNTKKKIIQEQKPVFTLHAKYSQNETPALQNCMTNLDEPDFVRESSKNEKNKVEQTLTIPTITIDDSTCQEIANNLQVEYPVMPTQASTENESQNPIAARITINSDREYKVEKLIESVEDVDMELNEPNKPDKRTKKGKGVKNSMPIINYFDDEEDYMQIAEYQEDNTRINSIKHNISLDLNQECRDALKMISQYSISQRNAVQIIVNRYIYCSHHVARNGLKRRWRCLDYRKVQCPAFIDSFKGIIVRRKGEHNHAYHDGQIYKKHKAGKIFHTMEEVFNNRDYIDVGDEDVDAENGIVFSVIPNSDSKNVSE